MGFDLTEPHAEEIRPGKGCVQVRSGPFDLDFVFAPDRSETFDDAWRRCVEVEEAANRVQDRESLPRLRAFRDY